MNRSLNLACIAAALALSLGVSTSQASQVTLPLGINSNLYSVGYTLISGDQIKTYFNGGDDSGGQGPGPTLGFTFSGNAEALKAGRLGGAGIDVLPQEPPVDGDPLLDPAIPNLLLTPHIAWAAREARQRCLDDIAASVQDYLKGGRRSRVV